jgi:hypothetical protein
LNETGLRAAALEESMNDHGKVNRRTLVLLAGAASLAGLTGGAIAAPAPSALSIKVYEDPQCGCCGAWVDHLKAAGFKTTVERRTDLNTLNKSLGVPDDLTSCHTGVIEGYAITGHVPASDIKRLIASRPRGKGLAVPGMPTNSPGMEMPGEANERYTVWLFQADGKRTAFATHG